MWIMIYLDYADSVERSGTQKQFTSLLLKVQTPVRFYYEFVVVLQPIAEH